MRSIRRICHCRGEMSEMRSLSQTTTPEYGYPEEQALSLSATTPSQGSWWRPRQGRITGTPRVMHCNGLLGSALILQVILELPFADRVPWGHQRPTDVRAKTLRSMLV